jgi:outer membrane lipoprotein-sorting protein
MHPAKKVLIAAFILLLSAPLCETAAAQDLKTVLAQLDSAAAKFHSASAEFKYLDSVTDPVPDTETWNGVVYSQRKGGSFESAAHFNQNNGKPITRVLTFVGGVAKLYDKGENQVTVIKDAAKYQGYLALGFGASGKDLEEKFNVNYAGSETIDGVKTDKLELVAKNPDVLKMFPKITIWIDPARAVSLKQFFDKGHGESRTVTYSNIRIGQSLPSEAFTFKTDSKTQTVYR